MSSLSQDAFTNKTSRRRKCRRKAMSPVDPSVPPLQSLIEKLKRTGQLRYALYSSGSTAIPQQIGGGVS